MLGDDEIQKRFGRSHKDDYEHRNIDGAFIDFVKIIDESLEKDSRAKSLAITKLEEASMWVHVAVEDEMLDKMQW